MSPVPGCRIRSRARIMEGMTDCPSAPIGSAAFALPPAGVPLLARDRVDASHLLCLLSRARHALHEDPAMARSCLDDASRILRDASGGDAGLEPALVTTRNPAPVSAATGGLASWQVRKVVAHVEKRLECALPTGELATGVGLSAGHFCRAFKVSMGETPHAYVIRQRIRRAQVLMLETRQSLSEIALACGLTDQAHLTRLFKRLVGTTPLAWRRACEPARQSMPSRLSGTTRGAQPFRVGSPQ